MEEKRENYASNTKLKSKVFQNEETQAKSRAHTIKTIANRRQTGL